MAVAWPAGVIAIAKVGTKSIEEVFIQPHCTFCRQIFLDQYFPDQYAIAIKLAVAAKSNLGSGKNSTWSGTAPLSA